MSRSLIAQRVPLAVLLASAFALTACGSGGGSSSSTGGGGSGDGSGTGTVAAGPAEGLWGTRGDTGYALAGVTLESGEFWFLLSITEQFATAEDKAGTIVGLLHGDGTYESSTFTLTTGTGTYFQLDPDAFGSAPLTSFGGRIVAKSTFEGAFKAGAADFSFITYYGSSYDQSPPQFSSLAGTTWGVSRPQISAIDNWVQTVTGAFQVSSLGATGCALQGQLSQRVSGKNVMNFTGAFSAKDAASTCNPSYAGKTFKGVAEYTKRLDGGERILVKALDSAKAYPLVLLVDR